MLDKIRNDELLSQKVGLITGSLLGFILGMVVSGKVEQDAEIEYIVEEETNNDETE